MNMKQKRQFGVVFLSAVLFMGCDSSMKGDLVVTKDLQLINEKSETVVLKPGKYAAKVSLDVKNHRVKLETKTLDGKKVKSIMSIPDQTLDPLNGVVDFSDQEIAQSFAIHANWTTKRYTVTAPGTIYCSITTTRRFCRNVSIPDASGSGSHSEYRCENVDETTGGTQSVTFWREDTKKTLDMNFIDPIDQSSVAIFHAESYKAGSSGHSGASGCH